MDKESFIDTNVIVHYANYQEDKSIDILKRCYSYVINKQGKFIICYMVIKELYTVMSQLSIIHKEVLMKVKDNNHSMKDNKNLSEKDLAFAEKVYSSYNHTEVKKLNEILSSEREIFEISIERFLKTQVDEKVIPIEQIQTELVNKIHDIIPNHADCKILASALQLQKIREPFLFVTADGKDLAPNHYDFLKEHFRINYSREGYLFPEMLNLMFTE
ncbi:MAG: PIN domain-containing protein [Nanoarchaeota archaeon]